MAKTPNIVNIVVSDSTTQAISQNFKSIQEQFKNTLSRDGSLPNNMDADLDMNSRDILNVDTLDARRFRVDGKEFWDIVPDVSEAVTEAQLAAEIAVQAAINASQYDPAYASSVSPEAFGAVSGGIVDSTIALKAAVASGAKVIDGGNRTYKVNGKLSLSNKQTLRNIELDFSGYSEAGSKIFLEINGQGVVDSALLVANVAEGTYTVDVDPLDGSKFAPGDYVRISSTEVYPYTGATVRRGEIRRVRSVVGGQITFREATYEAYNLISGVVTLSKLSMKEDVTLDGVTLIGIPSPTANCRGVQTNWTKGLRIVNSRFKSIDTYCAALFNSVEFNVSSNSFEGVYYAGEGTAFYGILVSNCCQWGVIHGNIGEEVRHLVTTTSSATYPGQPYHIVVSSNVMHNAMAGGATDSWAYENHGFGRWIIWNANVADGCRVGFNLERGDQVLTNNIVRNFSYYGIYFDNSSQDLQNVLVQSNFIQGPTFATTNSIGIRIEAEALSVRKNIKITDNIISLLAQVGNVTTGIWVGLGNGPAVNCSVENNTITREGTAPYSISEFGVRTFQQGWTIKGNIIRNFERAIFTNTDETVITGNVISNALQGANATAVEVQGSKCIVSGNSFFRMNRAVAISAASDSTVVVGNTQIDSTVPTLSDSGTNTVTAFAGGGF